LLEAAAKLRRCSNSSFLKHFRHFLVKYLSESLSRAREKQGKAHQYKES